MPGDRRRVTWLALSLAACLPVGRPSVQLEPGASLSGYRVFDVRPVVDKSGWPFPYDITDSLRNELAHRLREHGYTVTTADSTRGGGGGAILGVESRLTYFQTGAAVFTLEGGPGGTRCALTSVLMDAASGRRLGEIAATEQDQGSPFEVLMSCARVVADEINRRVREK